MKGSRIHILRVCHKSATLAKLSRSSELDFLVRLARIWGFDLIE